MPFITAWTCLVDAARLTPRETVVVSGAAGAVGWAAVELASALAARVVALVKNADQASRLDRSRVAGVARTDLGDLVPVVHEVTGGKGAQVALNGVGAPVFRPLLESLGRGGRLCVYSAAGGREVPLDPSTSTGDGCGSSGSTPSPSPRRTVHGCPGPAPAAVRIRSAPPHPVIEPHPLEDAARAYEQVARGSPSEVVLVPRVACSRVHRGGSHGRVRRRWSDRARGVGGRPDVAGQRTQGAGHRP